jgi:hypothetical protein
MIMYGSVLGGACVQPSDVRRTSHHIIAIVGRRRNESAPLKWREDGRARVGEAGAPQFQGEHKMTRGCMG